MPNGLQKIIQIPFIPIAGAPKKNYCAYLGAGSRIETEMSFGAFFDNDHTLTAWFMPQYPPAGYGPILASSGTGMFFLGQGNYRDGNAILKVSNPPVGGEKAGDAVLTLIIGAQRSIYLAPEWKAGVWQHIAAVRKGNTYGLYLNGKKLPRVSITANYGTDAEGNKQLLSKSTAQVPDPSIPPGLASASLGKVIIGHSRHPTLAAYAHAYGLVDDVAVFDRALSIGEIGELMAKKRLNGYETGLLAGWGLDISGGAAILPAKLAGATHESSVVDQLHASGDRNSANDRGLLDFLLVFAQITPYVQLPIPKGEEWTVVQGYADPVTSHNGDVAFCYDFVAAKDGKPQPDGTKGKPVFACAGGEVLSYLANGEPKEESDFREPNYVHVYTPGMDLIVAYLHFEGRSLTKAVTGGAAIPTAYDDTKTYPPNQSLWAGNQLGTIGKTAKHLHLGSHEMYEDPSKPLSSTVSPVTRPLAFKELRVRPAGSAYWHNPVIYIPKKGDLIMAL
jgi:Concanavalin A-like lectin/glucanases superfamily